MAWNEPGKGNHQDPWKSSGGSNQEPPDLEELLRGWQQRLSRLFGGNGSSSPDPEKNNFSGGMIGIFVILIVLWLGSGFYIVDEGKQGIVLTLGEYSDSTEPGLRWHIPYPIEEYQLIDVKRMRFVEVGYRATGQKLVGSVPKEALMLTQDENIVDVRIAVQYQVKNARNYLFNVVDPDLTLKQSVESAVREVVGGNRMDFILKEGRSQIASDTQTVLQRILDDYETGLLVSTVNLQDAQPPEEVQDAFTDAVKAREDEIRQKNEAEAYKNEILPKARGLAARKIEEANAYQEKVIAQARGEAERFEKLLIEYEKAPEVTRQRLYLETMEQVLKSSPKVFMDANQNNGPLLYLPIDQMMKSQAKTQDLLENLSASPLLNSSSQVSSKEKFTTSPMREDQRGRRPR